MGYKAIAIPVTFNTSGPPKFCIVRDRRFKDWTFITGGCRKREIENPIRCALRELCEETRSVIKLFEGKYASFSINVKMGNEIHIYNIFVFLVDYNEEERVQIVYNFNDHKKKTEDRKRSGMSVRLVQDENDSLQWVSLDEMLSLRVWSVAKTVANSDLLTKIAGRNFHDWLLFSKSVVYGDKA